VIPGEINIVPGALLREKLKSGGANVREAVVVLELTELDVVEEVAAVLEDVVALEEGVVALEVDVVLVEEAFCAALG
jgi:hypothetical protein